MPIEPSHGRIPTQRDLFEIPEGVSYLNCASMSPRLRSVSRAGFAERLAEEKVFISIRGDAIRVAPHLYNDAGDIEKLFAVLKELI